MQNNDDANCRKMIDEAVRRILIAEGISTIDRGHLRDALHKKYEQGGRDMFTLVKLGRHVVHSTQSGHL